MTQQAEAERGDRASTEDWREAMTPRLPGEGMSFDEVAQGYHFGTIGDRRRLFAHMILHEVDRREREGSSPVVVLDIGCGRGIGRSTRYQRAIRERAGEMWGIEPDPGVTPEEGLFDRYETALMETANLPESSVDVAYAFMVMEHVVDPGGFFASVRRALKPGGSYMFMTVNGAHYFTRAARAMHTLKIDEALLKVVQRKSEDYHYPVAYRANSEDDVRRRAGEGWESVDFAYCEADAPSPYLPGPLQVIAKRASSKRRQGRDPRILLNLVCRMRKSRA